MRTSRTRRQPIPCCLTLGGCLVLLGASAVFLAPAAHADEIGDWRAALVLKGNGTGKWAGVFQAIERSGDPSGNLERTLAPLFAADSPLAGMTESHRNKLLEYVILVVLKRPDAHAGEPIILADALIKKLAGNDKLVGRVKDGLPVDFDTREQTAWIRLLDHAASVLARKDVRASDVPLIENAIWLLGHHSDGYEIRAVAAIADHARRKVTGESALADVDDDAYLDAFHELLGHRFATLADADRWLSIDQADILHEQRQQWIADRIAAGEAFVTLLKRVIKRPSVDRKNAIAYGKLAIAAANRPEDLAPRFTTACPYAELRIAALQKAAALKPDESQPWIELITGLLQSETESSVVEELLKLLSPYTQPSKHTPPLVDAILVRLQDRDSGDTVAQRAWLIGSLSVLGSLRHIEGALLALREVVETGGAEDAEPIYALLLRKAGQVEGGNVASVVPHYFPFHETRPSEVIRQAVAEALGEVGIRKNEAQAVLAPRALRLILSGSESVPAELQALGIPEQVARETAGAVRRVALESLSQYPDVETIHLLSAIAVGKDAVEAGIALGTFGEILATGSDAEKGKTVDALRDVLAADPALSDEITIKAIAALEKLPATATLATQSAVGNAVNDVIAGSRGEAVRLRAAAAATRLRVSFALDSIAGSWRGSGGAKEWAEALAAMVATLSSDPAHDKQLLAFIDTLARPGGDRAFDPLGFAQAVDLAGTIFEKTGRAPFAHVKGELLLQRSGVANADPAQRRQDLTDAIAVLSKEVGVEGLGEVQKRSAFTSLYAANMERAGLEPQSVGQVEFFLNALEAAGRSGDVQLAQTAVDPETGVRPKLNQLSDQLDDAQKKRKANAEDSIDKLIG